MNSEFTIRFKDEEIEGYLDTDNLDDIEPFRFYNAGFESLIV